MTASTEKVSRRDQILQTIVVMLEEGSASKITTANLAKRIGVSEAALYRHFPSKMKMYEGLLEFIEQTIFSRVNLILNDEPKGIARCEKVLYLILLFSERNPGMTRILNGEALSGDTERLSGRVVQFFDRIETQLKQIIRDAEIHEGIRTKLPGAMAANMLLLNVEGRISQFSRSNFQRKPTQNWDSHWPALVEATFQL